MWNCVEDRVGGDKFGGRVIRRIIFDDIYADRIAVLSQNPISRAAYPHLKVNNDFEIFPAFSRSSFEILISYAPILIFFH
jgi:hypothetical protein